VIAALYIDPLGPYPKMQDVDCWDEGRDARLYNGPYPCLTHPPCGPWGSLRNLGPAKSGADCGPRAVEQVRAHGGLLEHPRGSTLWTHESLPRPGELPDAYGGWSIAVEQVSWGHVARKPTWLYLVGIDRHLVASTLKTGGEPTHVIGRPGHAAIARNGITWPCAKLKATSSQQNRRTPAAFAEWLVMLVRSAKR
jgi:hypothetical protein